MAIALLHFVDFDSKLHLAETETETNVD